MALRLVMMGTGSFALPTFRELLNSSHPVVGLFTQPDRAGRGHHHHAHPMKQLALESDVPVFQPRTVRKSATLDDLRRLEPDLCVVAAYGQILPRDLLAIPGAGAINLHASLLPKYRGAAPVQYAIRRGETETGVTVFQIEPQLDAGLILGTVSTRIEPKETAGELEQRLAKLAVALTLSVIDQIDSDRTRPVPQDPGEVSQAPRLAKSEGQIDWTRTSLEICCHIRAMQPWPQPFTWLFVADREPVRVLILDAEPVDLESSDTEPGTILPDDERILVWTGNGALEIVTIRPEGKRTMSAAEFLRGHKTRTHARFDAPHDIDRP